MYFIKEDLEKLQQQIDKFEFYQTYLPDLTQRGRLAWACCPFHQETKASFSVDINTGIWKCWGEGLYGSIFSFYQNLFNLTFVEAVQQIAEKYNFTLTIDEETKKQQEYIRALEDINKIVNEKFKQNLINHNGPYNYLTKIRGLSPKIIKDFELGLGLKKLPIKESLKTLDLIRGEEDNLYATFRSDRVTFPLKNEYGKIIGFAGRFWEDKDGAKYMYNGNTPLFKKGDYIYGLYEAKKYIKHFNSAILVEGPLDMIKCHQKGILNAVSIGGINLSQEQISKLKKFTNTFYIVIEDKTMLEMDINRETPLDKMYNTILENIPYAKVYILDLRTKDGGKQDPDMFLQKHNKNDFYEIIKHAPIYNEFIINNKLKNVNPKNIEEKTSCINSIIPMLVNIKDYLCRRQYIELVSNKLLIPENDIYKKVKNYSERKDRLESQSIIYDSRPVFAQKMLLSICFAPNFNNFKATGEILVSATNYMEPFYKNILTELIAPYIYKHKDEEKIDFTDFFNNLLYDENHSDLIKKTLFDIYLKVEQLEEFTDEDLSSLIDEQIETLDEYIYQEPSSLNNDLSSLDI